MQAVQRAWRGARNEWRMHVMTALTSSVAFLCLAFALLMVVNLNQLQERWESVGRISAYLLPSAGKADADRIIKALEDTGGVEKATYVSSKAARAQLMTTSSTAVLRALPVEAFPPSIELTLEASVDREQAQRIAEQVSKLNAIESVETYGEWSARVTRFLGAAIAVAVLLAAVVFFAVITTVSSATTLMLERRRVEVEVLRVVGATADYVRGPFMLEGAAQGAIGAAAAVVIAALSFAMLRGGFDEQLTLVLGATPRFLPWTFSLGLVGVGGGLGALAALGSLRKSSLT